MYLAQYSYSYPSATGTSSGVSMTMIIIYILAIIVYVAASWKIFTKAGLAGWKALIPIYSSIITMRIIGLSGWYVLLYFVPLANIVFAVYVAYKLAKAFGYGVGMTILELLGGIGTLIIAFGKAQYLGPDGTGKPQAPAAPTSSQTKPPVAASRPRPLVQ